MATKLKNLKITKVDFVDEGANPDAHIMLFKSKCGDTKKAGSEEDETGEGAGATGDPEETEKNGKAKKSLKKRLLEAFAEFLGTAESLNADTLRDTEDVAKSTTFKENINRRQRSKIYDDIWNVCYALEESLCSIITDEEIDATEGTAQMNESVDEFCSFIKEAIPTWMGGSPTNVIMKSNDMTKERVQSMIAMRDRMNEIIEKSLEGSEGIEETLVNKAQSNGGNEEMKIDKSKMTPAERAMLEEFAKKYATEDAGEGTQVEKGAHNAPEGTVNTEEANDIYKGMTAEAKAEIEALKKFKEEAEDRELRSIAKSYEIIGKKEEDLFPVLKSLKATSIDAFDSMIDTLNSAKESVEKSAVFQEVGKSGNGQTGSDPWSIAEAKAAEIMKSKSVSKNVALQEVFTADPELATKCKEEA